MKSLFHSIAEMLPYEIPYKGFDHRKYEKDLNGGTEHSLLEAIIDKMRPRLIIEVGSWKGTSAVYMAGLLRERQIDGLVLCIDTWLGTVNNMLRPEDPVWGLGKYYEHGYPTLYYQFLANVMHCGLQEYILPLPTTSTIGARWLTAKGIAADMVYIDASHEEEEIYSDMTNYWKILRPGGILVGDDWNMGNIGVICAVNAFSKEKEVEYRTSGSSWLMKKTA